jgi:rare lipoprotein A (peptidoglycan hydrolase)
MKLINHIIFFVCTTLLLPLLVFSQNLNTNNLTTSNYLDSAFIKKHKKKVDTSRIKVEFNRVKGIASFYSKILDGTLTSTGERYRNNKYTAASNFFKLNTLVRVTNLKNGTTVVVRINDRMHPNMMRKGRVIDLSQVAAKKLLFKSNGIVRVNVEALGYSKINPTN